MTEESTLNEESIKNKNKKITQLCISFILYFVLVKGPILITHSSISEAIQSHTKLTYCDPYDYFTPCMHNCLSHFANIIINQHGSFQNYLFTPVVIELQSAHSIKVT